MTTNPASPPDAAEVRERLEEALRLNLIGPGADGPLATEELPGWIRPSNWYLTGFLVPTGARVEQRADDDAEDDSVSEVADRAGLAEESAEDMKAAKRSFFPSSIGLSFLVAPDAAELLATVRWGEYERGEAAEARDRGGNPLPVWRRMSRDETVPLPLGAADAARVRDVPGSGGLRLHMVERPLTGAALGRGVPPGGIPPGARAVSVFLVNDRAAPKDAKHAGSGDVFQAEIEVGCEVAFIGRPDPRWRRPRDWDAEVADLHYADTPEYATGHGVSADWETAADGACRRVRTTWIPRAEVEKIETAEIPGVELSMDALGAPSSGAEVGPMLQPLVAAYREWIETRRLALRDLAESRRATADQLLRQAEVAADRIERGIAILAADKDALDSFRMANRAVAQALRTRNQEEGPKWRAFQIGFILLNLPGLADPSDPHRETADLLFFPTGGGKTEAYLGLAAFAMVLRRLRNPEDGGRAGAGVSVIMRYTLRLLTFDQLGRAAGLVCALELEREKDPARYGQWPFEIGLWVGKAATPNQMGRRGDQRSDTAKSRCLAFQRDPRNKPAPIPLTNCPWCGTAFGPHSFSLQPNHDHPRDLRVVCVRPDCDFARNRALPIVAVDEPLYRRLPAFLIATVDKFASLPWTGPSGALLGGADRWNGDGFYGAAEPRAGKPLARPLLPPDLIVQDELHLISGPLGTMTGLYETAIDALASREMDGRRVRPKIVASTATANRAQVQVQAIFGRAQTAAFPPPGPDRRDSFFARTRRAEEIPARRYLGIAAPGRNPKVVMQRVLLTLAGAAQRAFLEGGGTKNASNPADPYMTLLAYFNALRELGGGRRIIEEEVQNTLRNYGERKRISEKRGLFRDRRGAIEVMELTSRVPTGQVAEARQRLNLRFGEKGSVAWAIATNMISVGLDIQRLGLMVVIGQPKTHSEYIQATSRVGRDDRRPGLVVTLLNIHKPRDRSHYERFRHYHETFYRSVEAASVTPFSARALDRGLAGAFVSLARHHEPHLTPSLGAGQIAARRNEIESGLIAAFVGRVNDQPIEVEDEREERERSVRDRSRGLLDSWALIRERLAQDGVRLKYQRHEDGTAQPLLREMLDRPADEHRRFRVGRSLRDVEPEVQLFLKELGS